MPFPGEVTNPAALETRDVTFQSDGFAMRAYLARPKAPGTYPAVIVLHEGAALKESDLMEWSKDRLAGYKRPRSYAFLAESEMPRNATGKVLHRELKARFSR